jgi:hypothetical protein
MCASGGAVRVPRQVSASALSIGIKLIYMKYLDSHLSIVQQLKSRKNTPPENDGHCCQCHWQTTGYTGQLQGT